MAATKTKKSGGKKQGAAKPKAAAGKKKSKQPPKARPAEAIEHTKAAYQIGQRVRCHIHWEQQLVFEGEAVIRDARFAEVWEYRIDAPEEGAGQPWGGDGKGELWLGEFEIVAAVDDADGSVKKGAKAGGKKSKANLATEAKETKQAKAARPKQEKSKRLSAIDAAAQVLVASNAPMSCKELIAAMAEQGLWTSPGGATPHATLYSAILREVNKKGKEARFKKADRGRFAAVG